MEIRVWSVSVDGRRWTFDDLDAALAYLRAELANNGARTATLESGQMTHADYLATVETEDEGAAHGRKFLFAA